MKDQVSEKDEMKEIIDEFIVEANELAEKAIQDIIAIENNPDEEIINSIFRAVHTDKRHLELSGIRHAVDPCP